MSLLALHRKSLLAVLASALAVLVTSAATARGKSPTPDRARPAPTIVRLANGAPGIGFDDRLYSKRTNRIYLPGGRSGNLFEIDPKKARSKVLASGFSATKTFDGGHDFGVTSVDAAGNFLVVTDRTSKKLSVVKLPTGSVVATAKLGASPDIVRYVAATKQLWITEPDSQRIEVFTSPSARTLKPRHVAYIAVPGGPEALVIDDDRGVAYSNGAHAKTVAIKLRTRAVGRGWTSGCQTPKEFVIDAKRNLAFTVCEEGGIYAVDLAHGRTVVGHAATGGGADFPGYAASLTHLYVASADTKRVSIIRVANNGALAVLGTVPTAPGTANAVADSSGHVWVPRPQTGDIMRIVDPFAPRN